MALPDISQLSLYSDYQLPELQSNDPSHGPLASRMATQRQALPDSGQTPTSSGTSANGTTAKCEKYFTNYELPEIHHFKISVKFKSTPVLEKDVTKEGGCLLHYQASDQPPITAPAEVERISIPVKKKNEQDGSLQEFPWDNHIHKHFTELILKNFHRGVEFYSREGNIYARRRSDTKLFWHSTQQEPGIAKELNRNEETEVFNMEQFLETLKASVVSENRTKLRLPAIWFSFAQKWDSESSPITTKLVWARVDPTRACEMVENVKPNFRSTESLESLHTSLFFTADSALLDEIDLSDLLTSPSPDYEVQSIDHSQGPSASRMALPDISQLSLYSGYQLPELHAFKVSVKFMSTPMLEKDVTKKGGCLLHYQPSDQGPTLVPAEVDRIPIACSLQEFDPWVIEKQNRFTEMILKSFHRGVEFYSREGNIYARRRSDARLFWHSTQQEPGIAKELNRNEETEVFNLENFRETLTASVALGDYEKLRLPAIWFSFAQKWDSESSPITTKLVWARVDPTRACEMVENVKPDVRSTESPESLHTSLFLFSNEARQSVPQ